MNLVKSPVFKQKWAPLQVSNKVRYKLKFTGWFLYT